MAGRVGRAAADGAEIKRQPRKQLVSARPAPDPAGGLEQVSARAPGAASGDHSSAHRTSGEPPELWDGPGQAYKRRRFPGTV